MSTTFKTLLLKDNFTYTELREGSYLVLVEEVPREGGKTGSCAKRRSRPGEILSAFQQHLNCFML